MKNSQRGVSTLKTLIIGLIIVVIIGLVVYFATRTPVKNPEIQPSTVATSTDAIASTTTTTISDDPNNSNLKVYTNSTLGFSFSYPREFVVMNEGFSTSTGAWAATFHSSHGDILIDVAKALPTGETKLDNQTITVGNKTASAYNTRRDTCDAHVVRTELDSDYKLQVAFQSCGDLQNSIYKNTDDINTVLGSITFTNNNSRLYVNSKLGAAFRYPIIWSRPTETATKSGTQLAFGKDLTIVSGAQYNTSLKRELTINEVVTGAITASSTTDQEVTVAGKPAHLLTTTPVSGSKQRVYYITHTSPTDMVIISQKGVDSEGLDLVISSLTFF